MQRHTLGDHFNSHLSLTFIPTYLNLLSHHQFTVLLFLYPSPAILEIGLSVLRSPFLFSLRCNRNITLGQNRMYNILLDMCVYCKIIITIISVNLYITTQNYIFFYPDDDNFSDLLSQQVSNIQNSIVNQSHVLDVIFPGRIYLVTEKYGLLFYAQSGLSAVRLQ